MLIHEVLLSNIVGDLWVALSAVGTVDCAHIFCHTMTLFFDYLSDCVRTITYL
jgi:hypothetical protein